MGKEWGCCSPGVGNKTDTDTANSEIGEPVGSRDKPREKKEESKEKGDNSSRASCKKGKEEAPLDDDSPVISWKAEIRRVFYLEPRKDVRKRDEIVKVYGRAVT